MAGSFQNRGKTTVPPTADILAQFKFFGTYKILILPLPQMNRSLREGNFYSLFLKALEYAMAHFVLDRTNPSY